MGYKNNYKSNFDDKFFLLQTFSFISVAWKQLRQSMRVIDPRQSDRVNFERAGTAPLMRTYKLDPTKLKPTT